jgi:hypothetical protein
MNLKIISWNVWGLNDAGKRLRICDLLKSWKPSIVCLQETKMEHIPVGLVRGLWGGPFMGWSVLPAIGASGGILLTWDKSAYDCIEVLVGSFSITYKFQNILDLFVWAFSEVYGPNVDSDRHYLWEEWLGVLNWWDIPCCIGGDFNFIIVTWMKDMGCPG